MMGKARQNNAVNTDGKPYPILLVPGFVADTYTEIEASFVQLDKFAALDFRFIWLVPEINFRQNRFSDPGNRWRLSVPEYVRHLSEHGASWVTGNISKWNLASNFLLFRRVIREYGIKAVYAQFGYERFWALFLGKVHRKETIWHAHWDSLGTRFVFIKRVFYSFFIDHYVAVSQFIARRLPRGADIHVVPNGVSPADRNQSDADTIRAEARKRLGFPAGATVILMVAAFTKQKRHAVAVDICAKVIAQEPKVMVVFLGDGPERAAITERIIKADLAEHFVLPGHVPNVQEYYSAADLCIFTAYNDAAPFAVLEAMKYGLPVVAFRSGGVSEVIADEQTGYLVEDGVTDQFAQRVMELVRDGQKTAAMGQKGANVIRNRYSRNTWLEQMRITLLHILDPGQSIDRD